MDDFLDPTQMDQAERFGRFAGELLKAKDDPEHPLNQPLKVRASQITSETQRFWILNYLSEANNALAAHMEVYQKGTVEGVEGGNPGRWSIDSAWGALQMITEQLAEQTVGLFQPLPTLQIPTRFKLIVRLIGDFHAISKLYPLVREGYSTNEDASKFAKALTQHLLFLTILLSHPKPQQVYNEWRKLQF